MARGSGTGSRGGKKLRNPEGFGITTKEDAVNVPSSAPSGDKAMEDLYAGKTIGSSKPDPKFINLTKNSDGSVEFRGKKYVDGKLQGANDPAPETPSEKSKRTKAINAYQNALKEYFNGGTSNPLLPERYELGKVAEAARKVVEVFLKIPGYAMGLSSRPYDGQFLPREGYRADMNSINRAIRANERDVILKAVNASGSDTAKDAYRWFALSKATEENTEGTIWYSRAWREIANRVK